MKRIYVFDLDGTLIDSMPHYSRGILSILDEAGISYDSELIKILTPLGNRKSAQYYIEHFGLAREVDELTREIEEKMIYAYNNLIDAKPGIHELLKKLSDQGARLFVLTASPHLTTDACLKKNGLYDRFETVWSVDDYRLTKSDTRIFYELANRIGCEPEEIHYFDDSLIALDNAKAAGLITYGVHDAQSDEEIARMKRDFDHYVDSFSDFEP